MLKLIKIFCLLLLCTRLTAQVNLVQNGSFEDISDCPGQFEPINTAMGWFKPSTGTSDLFNGCAPSGNQGGVPENWFGFQDSLNGAGYVGIFIYRNSMDTYREYIGGNLISPLKPNHYYCLSFYVSMSDIFYFPVSTIGAYFSLDSLYIDNNYELPYFPQIENTESNFIADSVGWQRVSGYFKAIGGERFLYIGNFKDNQNTICLYSPGLLEYKSYIYIDNVQLYECDSLVGIDELPKDPVSIYPNPAQDFVTIETPQNYNNAQLSIYNLTGQLISQKQITQSNQKIPITELGNGMYIFVIQNGDKVIGRQRVVVAR